MTPENQDEYPRTAIVREVLCSPGAPLAPAVRKPMEACFGRDFGRVRAHTDDRAAASARALNARAYTTGAHIVFGEGRYDPWHGEGLWLLAHELTHVVQQGGNGSLPPLRLGNADDPLERTADQAADLIAAGRSLPPDFAFGAAPAGVVQRHAGPQCGGWSAGSINAQTVFQAHWVIEQAYKRLVSPYPQWSNVVFYGSNWDSNFEVPGGMLTSIRREFATELLRTIRLRPAEERPNIIDFAERVAYFFWRHPAPGRVARIINHFHATQDRIGRKHEEVPWASREANWYPDHILPFAADPRNRFACTSMTDHNPPRGLILYDVRQPVRPRQSPPERQPAMDYRIVEVDEGYAEVLPTLRAELPKKISFHDPANPEYVIIVPSDFYREWFQQRNARRIDKYHFQRTFLKRNVRVSLTIKPTDIAIVVIAGTAAATLTVMTFAGAFAIAGEIAAGIAAMTTATASAGAAHSTIVVPAAIAGQVAAAGTVSSGTVVAAYGAMLASPVAKAVAATAGALLVIGRVKDAKANKPSVFGSGGRSGARVGHGKPTIGDVSAFRAVAVTDFQNLGNIFPFGNLPAASTYGPPKDFVHAAETTNGKLSVGTRVLYNLQPHYIICRFSVR